VESVEKMKEMSGGGGGRINIEGGNMRSYLDAIPGGKGKGSTIELYCGCDGSPGGYEQREYSRTSLTVLAHELQHASDFASAEALMMRNKKGIPYDYSYDHPDDRVSEFEQRAVRTENIVREAKGEKSIRREYGGDPVRNPEPENSQWSK
jgi:hypothetical protein